jgi:hypothetical protein
MMNNLVKRLCDWADFDGPYGDDLAQLLSEAADRIEDLKDENAALAAWQCPFTDGKTGLYNDEYGHQHCKMQQELEQAQATLERVRVVREMCRFEFGKEKPVPIGPLYGAGYMSALREIGGELDKELKEQDDE